jgi:hypothetical protein
MTLQELMICVIAFSTFAQAIYEATLRQPPISYLIGIIGFFYSMASAWLFSGVMNRIKSNNSWWFLLEVGWLVASVVSVVLLSRLVQ